MNGFAKFIIIISIAIAIIGGWLLGENSTPPQINFALGVIMGCMFVACMWISASDHRSQSMQLPDETKVVVLPTKRTATLQLRKMLEVKS